MRTLLLGLVIFLAPGPGSAQQYRTDLRYPLDLAPQLVSEDELRSATACNVRLTETPEPPGALLESRPVPLGDLAVTAETRQRLLSTSTQWEMPPFSELDPPPPRNLPPAARELWTRIQARSGPAPEVFSDLPSSSQAPSALLRPRPAVAGQRHFTSLDLQIPPPFSSRRYESPQVGFFQISLYGGTTSFAAEDAYRALRHAAPSREPIEGVGRQAFLTHLVSPDYVEPVVADPNAIPWSELTVVGRPRPDLLDPGLVKSSSAPAFEDIATPVKATPAPRPAKTVAAVEPAQKPELVLLVFYLPEKSVTVELALDDRIGTVQNLIALALMVNQKLLNQW